MAQVNAPIAPNIAPSSSSGAGDGAGWRALAQTIQQAVQLRGQSDQAASMVKRAVSAANKASALATQARGQVDSLRQQLESPSLSPDAKIALQQKVDSAQARSEQYGSKSDQALELAGQIRVEAETADAKAGAAEKTANDTAGALGQARPFTLRGRSPNDAFQLSAKQIKQQTLLGAQPTTFQSAKGAADALGQLAKSGVGPADVASRLEQMLDENPDASFRQLLCQSAAKQLSSLAGGLGNASPEERRSALLDLSAAANEGGPEVSQAFTAAFKAAARSDANDLSQRDSAELPGALSSMLSSVQSGAYREALAQEIAPSLAGVGQQLDSTSGTEQNEVLGKLASAFESAGVAGAGAMAKGLAAGLSSTGTATIATATAQGTLGAALPEQLAIALRASGNGGAGDVLTQSVATALRDARVRFESSSAQVGALNGQLSTLVSQQGSQLGPGQLLAGMSAFQSRHAAAYGELQGAAQQLGRLLDGAVPAVTGRGPDGREAIAAISSLMSATSAEAGSVLADSAVRQFRGQASLLDGLPAAARQMGSSAASSDFLRTAREAVSNGVAPEIQRSMDGGQVGQAGQLLQSLLSKNPALWGITPGGVDASTQALKSALGAGGGTRLSSAVKSLDATMRFHASLGSSGQSAFVRLARAATGERVPATMGLPAPIDGGLGAIDPNDVHAFLGAAGVRQAA